MTDITGTPESWKREVEAVLEEIRPSLREHGGDAKLLGINGHRVMLELHGKCAGCPMAQMTFGIMASEMIRARVPEIEEVVYGDGE